MFFTQEDYKKIEEWLSRNAVRDTEFNEAVQPFEGNEIISFVQNGHNTKAYLKDFVNQLFLSSGTTEERPSDVNVGFQYFDTTINKALWWNGTNWVDATGRNVEYGYV